MYKWDIDELDRLFLLYKEKYENTDNAKLKRNYKDTMDYLLYLLDYYHELTTCKKNSSGYMFRDETREIIKDDLKIIRDYGIYAPIVRNFVEQFQDFNLPDIKGLSRIKTSPVGIVTMSNKFYTLHKNVFSDTYSELALGFPKRLYFKKASGLEDIGGNTHSVKNTNIVFIDVIKNNSIQDYISLIHECSHGMTSLLNPNIMWDFNKYCLIEVDSLFFEMLGIDYVGNVIQANSDSTLLKQAIFKDNYYSAKLICAKMDLYNELSSYDLKSKKMVLSFYRNVLQCSKTFTKDAMVTYIHDLLHYITSYLIAVELYYIYKENQEFALELLYKIILLKGLTKEEYLSKIYEMGIVPGKHIKEYCESIFEIGVIKLGKKV